MVFFNTKTTQNKRPTIAKLDTTLTWSYESSDNFMTAGIYTPDIMKALQNHLMFPQKSETVQRNLICKKPNRRTNSTNYK